MTATDRDQIFRTIVESAVDFAIVAMDRDGIVVEWNTGAERVLGWDADEIRGQPADRFFTPEDRAADRAETEMRLALRDGRASDERWHIRKDGTRFWANGEMMPMRDADGVHLGFVKIFRDRTAQRLEAERQRAEAEFMKGVLASSDDCIKVLDLDGRVTFMSEGGQRVMEVSDFNAIAGCPWPDFWEDSGNLAAREAIATACAGGSAHFQGGANTMAGNYRWWDVKVTPILGADGQPEKILSISRDVSSVRDAQETLRRVNQTLEQRVEQRTRERDRAWKHSIDLQAVVARDGTVVAANAAWTTILGWPLDEVIGRSHLTFNHPDHADVSTAALALGTIEQSEAYETRCLCRDGGERWISWVAAPEGEFVYASGRDVTAQKEQAATLAQVEEALRQAQKMEAVGQLTGGIAHDFNNMMTGVIGSIDLIQRNLATGRMDRVHRYLDAATVSAQRAAALTARLLAFGRRQSLDLQPIEVNRLVSGMEDLLYRTLGEQIALETHLSSGLWLAHTDANQLESALLNLCINARDAMPDGGRLTIETINVTLEAGEVADPAELAAGDYIVLCVSDTGSGMAPAIVGKVFEPFFTTKPVGQGTGLGLSMIYGFAKQSGGHVQIESEVGRGTTIRLFVPRFHGEKPAEIERPGPAPYGTGETVMVVEDDPSVRLIVLEVLEELGYHAIEAVDARIAIPILQSDRRIDLLVSDVGLPGMNGRQLAEIARQTRPALKVLFITGYAQNAAVRGGFLGEGMEMMTKPFAVEALATRIRELLGE